MSVKVTPDPYHALPAENCCICRTPTMFWYTSKDVALCEQCACKVRPNEIPTKDAWFAKERALRPFWQRAGWE